MLTNAVWGAPVSFSFCVFHRAVQVQVQVQEQRAQGTEREQELPQSEQVTSVQQGQAWQSSSWLSQAPSLQLSRVCADPSPQMSS